LSDKIMPSDDAPWTPILPRTKLGPHRQHAFQLENAHRDPYSHIRLTIYPDGGVKRLRVFGRLIAPDGTTASGPLHAIESAIADGDTTITAPPKTNGSHKEGMVNGSFPAIPAVMLTPEAFAPFGHVIQAWNDIHAVPRGIKTTPANQGTATKFHRLAPVVSSYPTGEHQMNFSEGLLNRSLTFRLFVRCIDQHLHVPCEHDVRSRPGSSI
jgi:allantoicase